MSNMYDRRPPQNVDAEQAVLGAMLMRPNLIPQAKTLLSCPDDMPFFIEQHQTLYDTLMFMDELKVPADLVTITKYLDTDKCPQSYLVELVSKVPTTANFDYYCAIVAGCEKKRRLITELANAASGLYSDADLDSVRNTLLRAVEKTKASATFQVDDLTDYWNVEPMEWTFSDILPREIAAVISSPGGLGKSLLAVGLGLSIATGLSLYPSFRPVDAPANVLYLSGEDPLRIVKIRLAAFERRYYPSGDYRMDVMKRFKLKTDGTGALIDVGPYGQIQPSAYYNHLYAYCEEIQPRLIIVDTLRRALGAASENDNAVVGFTMELITKLAKVSNGTALVLSHVSKQGNANKAAASADDARGASALKDEARTHFILRQSETGRGLTMSLVKANYSARELLGRKIFFDFDGAALYETGTQDVTAADPAFLIPEIMRYILEHSEAEPLTYWKITRSPHLQTMIQKFKTVGHDWATKQHVLAAIEIAQREGKIKEEYQTVGHKRKETLVCNEAPEPPKPEPARTYTPSLPGVAAVEYEEDDEPFDDYDNDDIPF